MTATRDATNSPVKFTNSASNWNSAPQSSTSYNVPSGGHWVYALITTGSASTNTVTSCVDTANSVTFTKVIGVDGSTAINLAHIWKGFYATSVTSAHVTVTTSSTSGGSKGGMIDIVVMAGDAATQTGAVTASSPSGTAAPSLSVAGVTSGSLTLIAYSNFTDSTVPSSPTNATTLNTFSDATNGDGYGTATASLSGTNTEGWTAPTGKTRCIVACEVLAAGGTPVTNATQPPAGVRVAASAGASVVDVISTSQSATVRLATVGGTSAVGVVSAGPAASVRLATRAAASAVGVTSTGPVAGVRLAASRASSTVGVASTSSSAAIRLTGARATQIGGSVSVAAPAQMRLIAATGSAGAAADVTNTATPATIRLCTSLGSGTAGTAVFDIFTTQVPTNTTADSQVNLGTQFTVDTTISITALRYFLSAAVRGTWDNQSIQMGLWNGAGTLLGSASRTQVTGDPDDRFVVITLSSAVTVTTGQTYTVGLLTPGSSGYPYANASPNWLGDPIDNSPLHTLAGAGCYAYGATLGEPGVDAGGGAGTTNNNYFADVVGTTATASDVVFTALPPGVRVAAARASSAVDVLATSQSASLRLAAARSASLAGSTSAAASGTLRLFASRATSAVGVVITSASATVRLAGSQATSGTTANVVNTATPAALRLAGAQGFTTVGAISTGSSANLRLAGSRGASGTTSNVTNTGAPATVRLATHTTAGTVGVTNTASAGSIRATGSGFTADIASVSDLGAPPSLRLIGSQGSLAVDKSNTSTSASVRLKAATGQSAASAGGDITNTASPASIRIGTHGVIAVEAITVSAQPAVIRLSAVTSAMLVRDSVNQGLAALVRLSASTGTSNAGQAASARAAFVRLATVPLTVDGSQPAGRDVTIVAGPTVARYASGPTAVGWASGPTAHRYASGPATT